MDYSRPTYVRPVLRGLLAAALLVAGGVVSLATAWSQEKRDPGREQALASIKQLGGSADETTGAGGKPVLAVNLSQTKADDEALRRLKPLTDTRSLNLNGCFAVGDPGLEAVADLRDLEELHLFGCHRITDAGFEHVKRLSRLRTLHIGYTGVQTITGSGLVHLKGMSSLRELDLSHLHKLDDRHLAHLAGLTGLEELNLLHCEGLTDAGMDHVGRLAGLRVLNLAHTPISDAGLLKLKGLKKLKQVIATESRITDAGLAELREAVPSLADATVVAKTYGSAFLDAHFEPGQQIRDAVRLRYKCQVAENTSTPRKNQQVWKIIFMFHFLSGDPGAHRREFQSNLYSWRFVYPHLSKSNRGHVPNLRDIQGESSLFLSVPDNHKDKKIGARSHHPGMFPTLDQEIDAIKDLWKREHVSQANLTGKTLAVEIARGEIATDRKNWSVHGELPADTYRTWTMTATWDGTAYAVDFVLPDAGARYFHPRTPTQIATEAFFVHPGLMRAYYWDLEVQREKRAGWEPIQKWKLVNTDAKPDENTWGMKRATFEGRPAIEVSNDGAKTYLKKGEVLNLK